MGLKGFLRRLGRRTDEVEHALKDEINALCRKIRTLRDDAKLAVFADIAGELPQDAFTLAQAIMLAEAARRAGEQ